MHYQIARDGVARTASCREIGIIESADLSWQDAVDLPDGIEFATFAFGGVEFKIYRQSVEVQA